MATVNEGYSHNTNFARLRGVVGFETILIVTKAVIVNDDVWFFHHEIACVAKVHNSLGSM